MRAALRACVALLSLAAGCGGSSAGDASEGTEDGGSHVRDGGDAVDGGRANDGGTGKPECSPAFAAAPVRIADPELPVPGATVFARSGDGVVGVWPGPDGVGYRVIELDPQGRARTAAPWTVWPDAPAAENTRIAVSGETVAIVDQLADANGRQTCRLGLARLGAQEPIRAPERFSDEPDPGTVLNEAQLCDVAASGDDFVLVWAQVTSNTTGAVALFAQWITNEGEPQGERLTVVLPEEAKVAGVAIGSNGGNVLVSHTSRKGSTGVSRVTLVGVSEVETELAAPLVQLVAAGDGFLARSSDSLWLLDREGQLERGPMQLKPGALAAPLGTGFVAVSTEEYLVARAIDATFASQSDPLGVGDERGGRAEALVAAPDGSATSLIYREGAELRIAQLSCSDEPPPPPGPDTCPEQPEVEPLPDGCEDEVCHVVLRFDYLTLALRGWSVAGGVRNPVDAAAAEEAARDVFDLQPNGEYLSGETVVSGRRAGLFELFVSPADFGAFALVGAESGVVVTAGGIVWSGRGDYWSPLEWKPASDIACGGAPVVPVDVHADTGGCDEAPEHSARGALDVALRSNLAAHVAAQGPFSAYVYLYTRTVGACDPGAAEYVVVLSQIRS